VRDDYRTKRKYRQRKLSREGFYELRQQRSRARRHNNSSGAKGIPTLKQIAHPNNLIRIFDELNSTAGQSAGPDRIAYNQLSRREVASIMRSLSKEILNGTFEPSKARQVRILKADGRSYRTLKIRSIIYRVVATALATAVGPFWDQKFLSGSHGFRTGRGVSSFLIDMERIITEQNRFVVAQRAMFRRTKRITNSRSTTRVTTSARTADMFSLTLNRRPRRSTNTTPRAPTTVQLTPTSPAPCSE
jgi:hypothetical protein